MIQAYPDALSVVAGGTLVLHVGTDHPQFRVVLFRQGATLDQVYDYGWTQTLHVGFNPGGADVDWGWDGYPFAIDPAWPSGAYIAMLWERDANGVETGPDGGVSTSDGQFGKALFVVRSAAPAWRTTMLYRVPIATYHAYNATGGGALYNGLASVGLPRVTMHRPGGGTGGHVTDFEQLGKGDMDEFDAASSRQTFEHYDAKFIRWMEKAGIQPDYCADIDCHGPGGLAQMAPYGVVISVGHDEYWSAEMKANLSAYVAQGGNLAMFSGDTCWWRIHYDQDLSGFACDKVDQNDQWWVAAKNDPSLTNENALTGTSYRNAGGQWSPGRPKIGFTVQRPDHWVFEGGAPAEFGGPDALIGYECDGAELTAASAMPGAPAEPTYQDGTPSSFRVLASALSPAKPPWDDLPPRDPDSPTAAVAPYATTMGIYTASGTAFSAAVTDWARVLEQGEPTVDRVTRNVIGRLGGISRGVATVANPGGLAALDGFFTADDQFRHAILGLGDGSLVEVFFNPAKGLGQALLGNFGGIVDVAGFYTPDDGYRHAIVAQQDGSITELFYHPQFGQGQAALGAVAGVRAIAGFYSDDDGYRHVIAADQGGGLTELFYHPQYGQGRVPIGNFPGLTDVSAFYSPDDGDRHAVALVGGQVVEVFFNPRSGTGSVAIAAIPDGVRVGAFYAGDDKVFTRRALIAAADGRLHEVRYSPQAGIVRSVIANAGAITDVGGFWSPDDGFRHAMIGVGDVVQEVFYRP
jgi:hypothetical protein